MPSFASTARHGEEFAAADDGGTSSTRHKTLLPILIGSAPVNRKVFAFNEGLDKVVLLLVRDLATPPVNGLGTRPPTVMTA